MEGFVTKRGHLITNWKVRWFLLENGEIKYYTDRTMQILKGRYILRKESIVTYHADMGLNKNVILIFTTSHPFRKKALYFSCESAESKTAWFDGITRQIEGLKTGKLDPVATPTIIEATKQSMDNMTSRINDTLSGAVTKVLHVVDIATTDSSTNDADVEELLRGRPAPRHNRIERGISVESAESAQTMNSARSARPISKGKRLSTHPVSPGLTQSTGYTAADYDSSDTDGSADERFERTGRVKADSDAARMRSTSTGHNSAQSAALAAEALNSPLLQKRSSDPRGKGLVVEESDLPRVSMMAAEEAAQANLKKMNYNSGSYVKPGVSPTNAVSSKRSISPKPGSGGSAISPTLSAQPTSAAPSPAATTPVSEPTTPKKKSSFTVGDNSWIKRADNAAGSSTTNVGTGEGSATGVGGVNTKETSSDKSRSSANVSTKEPAAVSPLPTTSDADSPWIEVTTCVCNMRLSASCVSVSHLCRRLCRCVRCSSVLNSGGCAGCGRRRL
jgi:hypothetical protein